MAASSSPVSNIVTPPGQTDRSPLQYEARFDAALTGRVENVNGNTDIWAVAEATSTYSLGARLETARGPLQAEGSGGGGFAARYKITLPGENQPPESAVGINPFDPTSIPVGATVTLDGREYVDTALAGSFNNIGAQFNLREAEGLSYSVARVDENNVRVTTGPYESVEAYNGIGLDSDIATAMLGRQDVLSDSRVATAQFDLSNPDGQAAYAHFVSTGEVAHETPGVSGVATIERIDYSSQTRARLGLGDDALNVQADLAGPQNTGQFVQTTYPDGSYAYTTDLQYSGQVPLQITQHFDTTGNEVMSERSYEFSIDGDRPSPGWFDSFLGANEGNEEGRIAANLNIALTGNPDGVGPVSAAGTTTIAFSENQIQALMAQTRSAGEATHPSNPLNLLVGGQDGRPVATSQDFAIAMARNLGGDPYGFAQRLFEVSQWADGDPRNGYDRIDATVRAD